MMPTYLSESAEQTGLLRGIATHKALSMIPLEAIANCLFSFPSGEPSTAISDLETRLHQQIRKALGLLQADGRMTADECARTDAVMLVRFFASSIGRRALRASQVHREWHFNLRAPELCESLLQGVIDLCFWEDGGWVLVDYKTDHVKAAAELWRTYGLQMRLYQRALLRATGSPVRESILFALALGEGNSYSVNL